MPVRNACSLLIGLDDYDWMMIRSIGCSKRDDERHDEGRESDEKRNSKMKKGEGSSEVKKNLSSINYIENKE
jgi:hypothetical protein